MSSTQPSEQGPRLRSMTEPQPLLPYLAELWERRQFTMSLATGTLRAQHLDTTLGNVWHVLNPAMLMAVYFLIFGVIIGTSRGVDNFIGFLAIGIFTFAFSQRTVAACGASIANNIGLIRSLQFPRAVLPISTVIKELTGYGFAAGVMLATLLLTGEPPRLTWLLVPFVVILLTMFNAGLGLVVARLTDSVRDLANIIPYLFRITFYLSGIIFSVRSFVTDEKVAALSRSLGLELTGEQVRNLFVFDPYFTYIELLRELLMTSYEAEHLPHIWLAAVVMAPTTFVLGIIYFRAGEKSYGRG